MDAPERPGDATPNPAQADATAASAASDAMPSIPPDATLPPDDASEASDARWKRLAPAIVTLNRRKRPYCGSRTNRTFAWYCTNQHGAFLRICNTTPKIRLRLPHTGSEEKLFFFVSCALVSLSLSVTGKKRRKTKRG